MKYLITIPDDRIILCDDYAEVMIMISGRLVRGCKKLIIEEVGNENENDLQNRNFRDFLLSGRGRHGSSG